MTNQTFSLTQIFPVFKKLTRGLTAALVLAGSMQPARALVQLRATAVAGSGQFNTGTIAPLTANKAFAFGDYSAVSRASASYGVLKVYTEGHAEITGISQSTQPFATATFRDDITISDPARDGQQGTLVFPFRVDGTLSSTLKSLHQEGDLYSYAEASLKFLRDEGMVFQGNERLRADTQVTAPYAENYNRFLNQTVEVRVPFTYGRSFELRCDFTVAAYVRGEFGGDAVADGEHTATWGGIKEILDEAGNPVTGYTMSSASGTNYTQPMGDPLAAFLSQYGLPAGSGGVDSDNDTLANALEFLLGGNPTIADAAPRLPVLALDQANGMLVYEFDKRAAIGNVTWNVRYSAALSGEANAVHGQNGVTITTTPGAGGMQHVAVKVPLATGARFLRLTAASP